MLRITIALMLLGCAASACKSGGGSDKGGEPTVVSEDVFRWSAQQAVNAVLLTENDLPANYDLDDETGAPEPDDPNFTFTGDCAEFNEYFNSDTGKDWRDSIVESTSGAFEDPDGDEFSSDAAVFRDANAAQAELDDMNRFFDVCIDQFEAQFTAYLADYLQQAGREAGKNVTNVAAQVTEISVTSQGEWTHTVRSDMTFNIDGVPNRVVSDEVTMRIGRMVASVEATYTGELEASLETLRDGLVATVAARLAAEEEKLPS